MHIGIRYKRSYIILEELLDTFDKLYKSRARRVPKSAYYCDKQCIKHRPFYYMEKETHTYSAMGCCRLNRSINDM